jgi:hypothetical protein
MTEIVLVTALQRRQKIVKNKTVHRSERQRAREQTADPHQPAAQEPSVQKPATQEPAAQEPASEKPPAEKAAWGTDTVPRHIRRPMGWAHTRRQVTHNYFRGNQFGSSDSDPDLHGASFELSSYKVHKNN